MSLLADAEIVSSTVLAAAISGFVALAVAILSKATDRRAARSNENSAHFTSERESLDMRTRLIFDRQEADLLVARSEIERLRLELYQCQRALDDKETRNRP